MYCACLPQPQHKPKRSHSHPLSRAACAHSQDGALHSVDTHGHGGGAGCCGRQGGQEHTTVRGEIMCMQSGQ